MCGEEMQLDLGSRWAPQQRVHPRGHGSGTADGLLGSLVDRRVGCCSWEDGLMYFLADCRGNKEREGGVGAMEEFGLCFGP